jgi:hypothetical protein
MRRADVPAGYSGIHKKSIQGNPIEFCIDTRGAEGKQVNIVTNPLQGVSLKVEECEFKAIVEFDHPFLQTSGLYDAKRWHVGFVQNLTSGYILFEYKDDADLVVYAAVAPETLPCKDSGSAGTWYDPSPLNLKKFGVTDEFAGDIPGLAVDHPARRDVNTRYIQMGDAPGTGPLPLNLACKASADGRATLNQQYAIGWNDPLNPDPTAQNIATLRRISGVLSFRTCLAMSSAPATGIRTTTQFEYLYYVDWNVNYNMDVDFAQRTVTRRVSSGSTIITEGLWSAVLPAPIVTAPDANESVCVKFL